MKIKDTLPQFENTKALIAVTGKGRAKFYLAKDGEIEEIKSIEIVQEKWESDKEGRMGPKTVVDGVTVGGRSVEEAEEAEVKKFLTRFEERIDEALKTHEPESVYVFSPDYILNSVLENIPNNQKDLIESSFAGNYADNHLFEILEMIQGGMKENLVEPKSPEAQKIYNKVPDDKA